jgi:hypothetical protein
VKPSIFQTYADVTSSFQFQQSPLKATCDDPNCMHVPPPPANQLVLVKMKKGSTIVPTFYPIELTGKLSLDANKDLESSYKIDGIKVKEIKQ